MTPFPDIALLFKVSVIVMAVWSVVVLTKRFLRRRLYHLPPGPKGLPFFGRLSFFNHLTVFDHKDQFGDVSYLKVFGKDIVVLNSIGAIREALTGSGTAENFSHRSKSSVRDIILRSSIVYGQPSSEWKQFKHMAHTLLKQHGEGINELEKIVGDELEYVTDLLGENLDRKLNIIDYIQPFTVNVLVTLLIGEWYEYNHPMLDTIDRYTERGKQLAKPFVHTLLKTLPMLRFLPFGVGRATREMSTTRDKILHDLFEKQKRLSANEIETRRGILFDLLRLQRDGDRLDDTKIQGLTMDIFGAGIVTTSATLNAFFLIILRFPEIQSTIQSEIDERVGQGRRPQLSDRSNMPYTRAVLLELLRYSSILTLSVPHACLNKDYLFGFTIPGGSIVLPNLFRVHHDEELWENPWTFDPHRFLDQSGQVLPASHPIRRNLIPFGIGKRACVGEVFAKSRIFLFIVCLLQRFTFVPADDDPPSCDPRNYVGSFIINPPQYQLIVRCRE